MNNPKSKKYSFLEYYKTILRKVSFDSALLQKEYRKAVKLLQQHERSEFEEWLESEGLRDMIPLRVRSN